MADLYKTAVIEAILTEEGIVITILMVKDED